MSAPAPARPAAVLPRWLPGAFLGLLVLPFHPFWVDFEQVRRGLLLVLAGASLLLVRRLPPVRGERLVWWFVGILLASAAVNFAGQLLVGSDEQPVSFQPWEAGYRLAHWLALVVVLRLGALAPQAFATPLATLLLLTSAFGWLQRLGLGELAGYGVAREPVSVFGNLNVAAEWTAVAACATAVLGDSRRWLTTAALALAGGYLVFNQSRSGLVGLPIGLLLLFALRRRERGWLSFAVCAGGAGAALLVGLACPRPGPADLSAANAERKRATVTLDVRLEIAKASTRLFGESPVFGHGPGQFAVQYPRVRSQDEIEASSHGRQFATEVRTAHDDWIELLVEGGLPALLLFALALFSLQRGAPNRARLLPLFVVLLLMLVRSPLGNAPAIAAAFLLAGQPDPDRPAGPKGLLAPLVGAFLAALGLLPIVGNLLAAPYQAARARGEQPPSDAIAQAARWMPFEPRWLQLLAQEQLLDRRFAAAAATAARAVKLRPHDPHLYLLLGEALAKEGLYGEAEGVARHALTFDPPNPELRVLLATAQTQRRQHDEAIAALVTSPHPLLRAQLGETFRALADLAERNHDPDGALRHRVEQHFVQAIDTLGDPSPAALTATSEHVRELLQAMRTAGLQKTDLRGHVLSALHALDLGQPDTAIALGDGARKLDVPLRAWQRALLGDKLTPLARIESWREVLGRR